MNKSFGETYIFLPARIIKENVIRGFEDKTENSFMIPLRFEYVCSFFSFFFIRGIFNTSPRARMFLRALFFSLVYYQENHLKIHELLSLN